MTSQDTKRLCLALLKADSEGEVITILQGVGYWENQNYWRFLGDDENNFRTVGGQQARSENALVEKLVNSADARLTAACIRAGIDPTSSAAPQTIDAARKLFFGLSNRADLAKGITVAVTGARPQAGPMPCITICDIGEGQTPNDVPETFMSITRQNKLRIPFVQGKFNMGGTGALMFCGRHKLQLLITRRDPEILHQIGSTSPTDTNWSFTVVRRETPPEGPGHVRNPYFKYLAPIGAESCPGRGNVLSFFERSLNLMPDGKEPYVRPMEWGSCIKLYEYDMRGFKGQALLPTGLRSRLEVLLPDPALPMRIHECRSGFTAHTFETDLMGLRVRLEESKSDNLEPGYPSSLTLNIQGQPMTARIYAFKGNSADSYRSDQGIIFTINGQTHGWFPKTFYERTRIKMGRLAKSLLVVVDCTDISVDARADLFKNSRDRLSGGDLRKDLEEELESQIANHHGLRALRERRRYEEVTEKLNEAKPLEDVLREIIKTSPSLSKLFMMGQKLSSPYRSMEEGKLGGGSSGYENGKGEFTGTKHPTFFHFDKLTYGEMLIRTCEHSRRLRLRLVTDVENEYFDRNTYRGRYSVEVIDGSLKGRTLTTSINLFNGVANWSVAIPEEDVSAGDFLTLKLNVEDDVIPDPIVNIAKITIVNKIKREGGGDGIRHEYSRGNSTKSDNAGTKKGKKGQDISGPPMGIELPQMDKVHRDGWSQFDFDENSGCTVIEEGAGDADDERSVYHFYINVDNIFLQTDIKNGSEDPAIVEAKFIYGNVLVGLALIHDKQRIDGQRINSDNSDKEDDEPIARRIEEVTRALSPFLIPMIEYLGGLESVEVSHLAHAGDEE
jgi:hypothetical protein